MSTRNMLCIVLVVLYAFFSTAISKSANVGFPVDGIPPKRVYISQSATRAGGWLPHDPRHLKTYIARLEARIAQLPNRTLVPPVQALRDLIESDGTIFEGATLMISQVPPRFTEDPTGGPRLRGYRQMCQLINEAVLEPPPYNEFGLVAFPINAILDWSMGTPAGRSFFLSRRVNDAFENILNYWSDYLNSPDSLIAFEDPENGGGGWMTANATAKLNMQNYEQPDPNALGWGFASWNEFFIRKFKDGVRPIADPDNDKVVVSACESTPFSLQKNVRLRSYFWLKGQPYALGFMLGSAERARRFVGGDVYQAFLSAFEYHRWHAPVAGLIKEAFVIPGTYYAQSPAVGFDPAAPDQSQSFITNVAARAVIMIESNDPVIGLMAVVAVGMSEVSSNVLSVGVNTRVAKGDELGYFQFGGSTHCLVFAKGVIAEWDPQTNAGPDAKIVQIGSRIARVADSL